MIKRQAGVHFISRLEVEIQCHSSSSVDPTTGTYERCFWHSSSARSVDQLS
jgi:hypothetical protein